jgi:hypothetical protein
MVWLMKEIRRTEPLHFSQRQPHMIEVMKHLDLEDEEAAALVALLTRTIADDRYPLSPRVRALKDTLAKLTPELVRQPLPAPKVYAPSRAVAARRGRR